MKLKNIQPTSPTSAFIFALLAVLSFSAVLAENETTVEHVIKEKPIVIHTQLQNYEQPTLTEYQECHDNRDKCLTVCGTAANRNLCEAECPNCPILISHDVVVQGINDTDYRSVAPIAGNTTNIIRLTNEIRNIIENNMGNITTLNENNVIVQHNSSSTGGEFGLGYNERGACCFVVRTSQNCDSDRFSTAQRCHHKRHRVCGVHCKARVMYAKRVLHCNEGDSSSCQERVTYSTSQAKRATRRCHYVQHWPFVSCRGQQQRDYKSHCQRCLQIPYGVILSRGIPSHCVNCYGGQYPGGYMGAYNPWYGGPFLGDMYRPPTPAFSEENYDWEENFPPEHEKGWTVEKTKCRGPDGAIIENCPNETEEKHENTTATSKENEIIVDPLEQQPEAQDEEEDYADEDDDDGDEYDNDELGAVEAQRRRRHTFRRSAYSHRSA